MNSLKTIAGSGLALMVTLTAPIAWAQLAPKDVASGARNASWSMQDTASVMDQNVSRGIKQAWAQGKDATLAMSFQENGEIAMGEGKENEARQYFRAAELELATLQPEHANNSN